MLAVVRLPSDLVEDKTGQITKLDSSDVINIDTPVSITIESSSVWHKVKLVGGKGVLSLYWFSEHCISLASSKIR